MTVRLLTPNFVHINDSTAGSEHRLALQCTRGLVPRKVISCRWSKDRLSQLGHSACGSRWMEDFSGRAMSVWLLEKENCAKPTTRPTCTCLAPCSCSSLPIECHLHLSNPVYPRLQLSTLEHTSGPHRFQDNQPQCSDNHRSHPPRSADPSGTVTQPT